MSAIPAMTFESLLRWQEHGTHPDALGTFVLAVLTNDLRRAVVCADDANLAALVDTVKWIYWNVPSDTYGSREALLAHHKRLEERNRIREPS